MYKNGHGVEKNINQAIKLYTKAARKGHQTALFNLGDVSFESSDYSLAARWHHKAAEKEHPGAQFKLGDLHRTGSGVEKDLSKSWHWYELAAANKHAEKQERSQAEK